MLTQDDLKEIETIVDEKLDEKLRFVPSKELFLEKMDALMGEVKSMREEFHAHLGLHTEIDDHFEIHDKQLKKIKNKIDLPL
jgi:hypothetical protein